MFPAPIRRRRVARLGYGLAVVAALAVWLLPMAGIALTSVRSAEDLNRGNFWGWPSEVRLFQNYAEVLTGSRMSEFVLNSFSITLPAVLGTIALASMAGFALAKHDFRGNRAILMLFIAGNLVPFQALMIPVRDLFLRLGLYDSRLALILFHVAFQTGFCTLFLRNFIRELPDAVLDAARIEGAGELRIFWSIVLPLVRPAIAGVSVLVFTFVWNDYFWALVLVQSDAVRPITAGLQLLRGMWQTSWQLLSAGSILAALPPLAVFFVMQRQLVAGLTYGAQADIGR
ncbi:MAG TPA: carbohydrate ABC transporter permease [Casimicrobiaceae bacterium]|nr:carbohydrate ABC transporter permease [Casimicrobiaceae bacterium]